MHVKYVKRDGSCVHANVFLSVGLNRAHRRTEAKKEEIYISSCIKLSSVKLDICDNSDNHLCTASAFNCSCRSHLLD